MVEKVAPRKKKKNVPCGSNSCHVVEVHVKGTVVGRVLMCSLKIGNFAVFAYAHAYSSVCQLECITFSL